MAATKRPATVKRTDPRLRPLDPLEGITRVIDADPDMRYVIAPEHGELDVQYYEMLGYQKVIYQEGGPRTFRTGTSVHGGPIVTKAGILMCIPREQHRETIYQPGQDDMGLLERRIYDKSFAREQISKVEGIRGMIGAEEVDAVNESSPLQRSVL
jgi:hypothetical protein